jgi:hypothetical protein
MSQSRTLASVLTGIALAILAGWILLTGGAPVEKADAEGPTTAEAIAKAGAKELPSNRRLTVEPAGYR